MLFKVKCQLFTGQVALEINTILSHPHVLYPLNDPSVGVHIIIGCSDDN